MTDDRRNSATEPQPDLGPEISEQGPDVSQLATTYGSSLVESEDQADAIADASPEAADGTSDGLGRPQPDTGVDQIGDPGP